MAGRVATPIISEADPGLEQLSGKAERGALRIGEGMRLVEGALRRRTIELGEPAGAMATGVPGSNPT